MQHEIMLIFVLSATEPPTTVLTLNFTGDNDSMWWNATTEMPYTISTERTTEEDFLIGDDVSPNATTLAPEVTTEFIPIYEPQCLENFMDECASCLKDPFFWTRGPDDSYANGGKRYIGAKSANS